MSFFLNAFGNFTKKQNIFDNNLNSYITAAYGDKSIFKIQVLTRSSIMYFP